MKSNSGSSAAGAISWSSGIPAVAASAVVHKRPRGHVTAPDTPAAFHRAEVVAHTVGFDPLPIQVPVGTAAAAVVAAAAVHSPARSSLAQTKKKRFRSEGEGEVEALMIQLQFEERQQTAISASPVHVMHSVSPLTSAPVLALHSPTPLLPHYAPTQSESVSLDQMRSYSVLQLPYSPAAAAAVISPKYMPTPFVPALIDSAVVTALHPHLASLPVAMSAEVLALLLLAQMPRAQLITLPAATPVTAPLFLQCVRSFGCQNDEDLQKTMVRLLDSFRSTHEPAASNGSLAPRPPSAFKLCYLACFPVLTRLTSAKRTLHLATARHYLSVLLLNKFPQHIRPLLAYLDHLTAQQDSAPQSRQPSSTPAADTCGTRFSFDQWSCVFEWCLSIDPLSLAGYEGPDVGSWPVFIDDFVTWLCRNTAGKEDAARGMRQQTQRLLDELLAVSPSAPNTPNKRNRTERVLAAYPSVQSLDADAAPDELANQRHEPQPISAPLALPVHALLSPHSFLEPRSAQPTPMQSSPSVEEHLSQEADSDMGQR